MSPRIRSPFVPKVQTIVEKVREVYDPWCLYGDDVSVNERIDGCSIPDPDEAYQDMLREELNDAKGG